MSSKKTGHQEIQGADLERAEKHLSAAYQIAVGSNAINRVAYRARINPEALEAYMRRNREVLFRRYLPDVDPRHEPAIMTMLVHMLAVGATAQRVSEGRS